MGNLSLIDFSNGIKSHEIQKNFSVLDEYIREERLMSSGWGHIKGLNVEHISFSSERREFLMKIDKGRLVNRYGNATDIIEQDFKLEPFETIEVVENISSNNGVLVLSKIPYERNGTSIPKIESLRDHISVFQGSNRIAVREIRDNILILGQPIMGIVTVRYQTVSNRYDILCTDKDSRLKVLKGTEVESRSLFESLKELTPICLISLIPYDIEKDKRSYVIEIMQMKDFAPRPIFINDKNKIEFYGAEFNGVREIHLTKPDNPQKGDIWYCDKSNTLKVWKESNGIFSWLTINDSTFSTSKNVKIWDPKDLPNDLQTFLFKDNIDMNFVPKTNSLEVLINNTPLMSDQFLEIVEESNDKNRPLGIGFKLSKPIQIESNSPIYVEAKVSNVVLRKEEPTFLERTATFVSSKTHSILPGVRNFYTGVKYYKDENQLSLFLNGKKLINKIDYEEIPMNSSSGGRQICNSFMIKRMLSQGDVLEHVININIYSYNHIEDILSEFLSKTENNKKDISDMTFRIESLEEAVSDRINNDSSINDRLNYIEEYSKQIEREQDLINQENKSKIDNAYSILSNKMDESDTIGIINELVYTPSQFSRTFFSSAIENIKNNGFVIDMRAVGNNLSNRDYVRVTCYDGNYSIELHRNEDFVVIGASGSIKINNPNKVSNAQELCVSGIQFL